MPQAATGDPMEALFGSDSPKADADVDMPDLAMEAVELDGPSTEGDKEGAADEEAEEAEEAAEGSQDKAKPPAGALAGQALADSEDPAEGTSTPPRRVARLPDPAPARPLTSLQPISLGTLLVSSHPLQTPLTIAAAPAFQVISEQTQGFRWYFPACLPISSVNLCRAALNQLLVHVLLDYHAAAHLR